MAEFTLGQSPYPPRARCRNSICRDQGIPTDPASARGLRFISHWLGSESIVRTRSENFEIQKHYKSGRPQASTAKKNDIATTRHHWERLFEPGSPLFPFPGPTWSPWLSVAWSSSAPWRAASSSSSVHARSASDALATGSS